METPDTEIRTIPFTKANYDLISLLYEKDDAKHIPKTTMYKVVNAMLELSGEVILNQPLSFLEDWEYDAILSHCYHMKFNRIEPLKLWATLIEFNEELGMKVRSLKEEQQLLLMLRVLYDRKTQDK